MSHYDWIWGSPPPLLKRHSEVKHALLRQYLVEYFLTLVSLPQQDRIQLTIVDGFCGGGLYINESLQEVPGSPIVILEAVQEAEAQINLRQERRKPIDIDVELICVDESRSALHYLQNLLRQRGFGTALDKQKIRLVHGAFADCCNAAVQRASDRSPKSGRALFVLDQFGYAAVPIRCLQDIFARLKRAEVILTFYVDALLSFLSGDNLSSFARSTGISGNIHAKELDEMKQTPNWRVHLQSSLYQSLTEQCSAKFYTPFFIRPERGHGDFWLLHLSQHWKARDVMATTHWSHHNHFAHYGAAGFNMFSTGYIGKIDDGNKLQAGFDFSEVAATVSRDTILAQIPAMLSEGREGMTVEQFFMDLINTTPATRRMVEATLLELHHRGDIRVVDEDGDATKARVSLKPDLILKLPSQRTFLF
jgi:three-Cys-motif partner protein